MHCQLVTQLVNKVLAAIRGTAGAKNLDLSLGYVGVQGSSYPINDVFLFTNGPQQGMINIALGRDSSLRLADLDPMIVVEGRGRTRSEEMLLHAVRRAVRDRRLSFLLDTWSGAVASSCAGT